MTEQGENCRAPWEPRARSGTGCTEAPSLLTPQQPPCPPARQLLGRSRAIDFSALPFKTLLAQRPACIVSFLRSKISLLLLQLFPNQHRSGLTRSAGGPRQANRCAASARGCRGKGGQRTGASLSTMCGCPRPSSGHKLPVCRGDGPKFCLFPS